MTTRVQALRSSTSGAVPTAGTRLAGELWTNFPDLQIGVIDAAKNAQKLVAVRYFSTTANYVAGDFVIQAGVLYAAKGAITAGAFNVTQWNRVGSATDGPYLPLAGGTMAGTLTLQGPPANPLEAATKAYVDSGAFVPVAGGANTGLNDNRLVNGDMRIDQRNAGASGTATGVYTVDRWVYAGSQASKGQWQRLGPGIGLASLGFTYCLSFTSTSAYASLVADTFNFSQKIEADMVTDFSFGTANAQPVTLSFLVQSTLTGTFSGSLANDTGSRAYPFTFSIPSANTWTKIVVTVPGDTTGTWVTNGNGVSMFVRFDLGCGTNARGSANAWASVNYVGVTGAVSVVGTNAAAFYVTGVKLEIGSVATPYNRQSLAKSMADCQRYYQTITTYFSGNVTTGGTYYANVNLGIAMRANPTVVLTNIGQASFPTTPVLQLATSSVVQENRQANATAVGLFSSTANCNAEL